MWSPDGTSIAFSSNRSGQPQLYLKPADGLREEVLLTDQPGAPTSWSRDGRYLLFTSDSPETSSDIWVLPNPGEADARPVPLIATEFAELDARVSPDGRWVAYTSNESSSADVFVRPFSPDGSGGGARYLVSRGLSNLPRWMADDRLVYVSAANLEMMAVEVEPGPAFQAGTPRRLFTGPSPLITVGWSPKPDGGFVFISTAADSRPAPFTVVLNWAAALDR